MVRSLPRKLPTCSKIKTLFGAVRPMRCGRWERRGRRLPHKLPTCSTIETPMFGAARLLCWGGWVKMVTDHVYKNATISRAEPDGLVIVFPGGIVKIPFTELSPELREKYHYNPQAAAAYQKQAEEAAQKWAQSMAEARERARQVNQSAVVAAKANSTPRPTAAR